MTTSDIIQIQGSSPDFETDLARQLEELIPEAITDGKVDVAKLRELLADDAGDENERFGLFWPGKRRAMRAAQEPTTATLKPMKDQSKDWDTTQNVFIEGDNLEVLKTLQKHYHNKIKMIYIDPPYNTGNDFVYPDNYKEGLAAYLEFSRQVDEGGKRLSTNSDSDGRYHSRWLSMMYPRLKLARNLLTDDGVIAISIDDHEADNLKRLASEIFGEGNFLGTVVWNHSKQTKNDEPFLASNHNYVLLYRRTAARSLLRVPRTEDDNRNYANPDDDPRGAWRSGDVRSPSMRPTLKFPIETPSGRIIDPPENGWRWTEAEIKRKIESGEIVFSPDESRIIRKIYLGDQAGRIPESIWAGERFGTTRSATAALKELFGGQAYFDTPKPVQLVLGLMRMLSQDDDYRSFTVLDFFSGSGTTAQAVMELNAEDGGTRNHIQVQLPEPTEEGSRAREAGLLTLAAGARRRIELAGKRAADVAIAESDPGDNHLDVGFRSYALADTNFSKWLASSTDDSEAIAQQLLGLRASADDEATPEALLSEVLLKQGYSLTETIDQGDVAGLSTWRVAAGDVVAYLDEQTKPNLDQLRALAESGARKLIILEDAFQGDDELKTNLVQLCKTHGVELWTA